MILRDLKKINRNAFLMLKNIAGEVEFKFMIFIRFLFGFINYLFLCNFTAIYYLIALLCFQGLKFF